MKNQPTIAALIPYPVYPAKMGGQKGIALFYQHLLAEKELLLLGIKGQHPDGNAATAYLPVFSSNRTRYISPLTYIKIKSALKSNHIRTLILEHPYFGWLGWLLSRFSKVRIVVHSHNIESERFRSTGKWWWRIMRWYEKSTHRLADLSFFVTPEDRDWAIQHYRLEKEKCYVIPYGSTISKRPSATMKAENREKLIKAHHLTGEEKILLFNGTLNYKPNLDALQFILNRINPELQKSGINYKIIVCGKGLPEELMNLRDYVEKNIIYAGFVEDIDMYFLGADLFLNPVFDGGGIKTKLVEALGANLTSISSRNGAWGIPIRLTGSKLMIASHDTADEYIHCILNADPAADTPNEFYDYFYWGQIAKRAARLLS